MKAFKDLAGTIPAEIGDSVALIAMDDTPWLSQSMASKRPVLDADIELNNDVPPIKLKMTVDEAVAFAKDWSRGMTIHEGSMGWRVVCMLLAEEVERLRIEHVPEERQS